MGTCSHSKVGGGEKNIYFFTGFRVTTTRKIHIESAALVISGPDYRSRKLPDT